MARAANCLIIAPLWAALTACSGAPRNEVDYGSSDKPLGTWPVAAARNSQPDETDEPKAAQVTAGSAAMAAPSQAPRGGAGGQADEPDDAGVPHEVVDDPPQSTKPSAPARAPRLQFTVTTVVQHPRVEKKTDPMFDDDAHGPKNMGAIWISTMDGKFVRSIEAWGRHMERSQNLVAFRAVCECVPVDVTASATPRMHREHVVTWDMTDRAGMPVPDGQYTLHVEVSDYDVIKPMRLDKNAMNAQLELPFDTRSAPAMLMPGDMEFFKSIKLEVLAP